MTRMTSIRSKQSNHRAVVVSPPPPCSGNGTVNTNMEYSFAKPYEGPPVNYPLPKAPLAIPKAQVYDPRIHHDVVPYEEEQVEVYDPINHDVVVQGIGLPNVVSRDTGPRVPTGSGSPRVTKVSQLPPRGTTGTGMKVDRTPLGSTGSPWGSGSVKLDSTSRLGMVSPGSPRQRSTQGARGASSPSPLPSSSTSPLSEASPMIKQVSFQRSPASEIEEVVPSPTSYVRRTPSFGEGESSALEEFSAPESGELTEPSPAVGEQSSLETSASYKNGQPRKKGRCYRCFKGNRLTDKETCLVCEKKFCSNCVLQVMGSMPEGRKCECCVGCPIVESRRPALGKPSRLLKRLIRDPLEIQQCMKSERECAANQLQPEQVFVNGRRLGTEDMALLPTYLKIKPGRYWYDKQSGLWGKDGEKADVVIPGNLKLPGPLRKDASNGGTDVYINGREITKSELKFLKMIGVQCTPHTFLYLNSDGDYGDELVKEPKGNLWNKRSKIMYRFFPFPTPRPGSQDLSQPTSSLKRTQPWFETFHKVLLLGHDGSGRSTIFKQAKIIENGHFSPEELQRYKGMIVDKAYQFLCVLLEARERFEEEDLVNDTPEENRLIAGSAYALDEDLKALADTFLDRMSNSGSSVVLNAEFRLARIWNEPAIQATLKRKDELHMLPDVANELLNRVLQSGEYVPTQEDILLAEGLEQGTGLAELMFTLEEGESESSEHQIEDCRYQLISIGGLASNEFRKWLSMFEDVQILVFCVAISDYDQWWTDPSGAMHNKLIFSRDLFVKIVNYPCFQDTPLVLLLNKFDKFEDKIKRGVPLTKCEWFSDYSPVGSSNSSQVYQAYMYVVHKYKILLEGRRIYTLQLNAQDQGMVRRALEYVQQVLKCEDEKRAGLWTLQDDSMYGDTTSFTVQNHFHDRI